MYFYRLSDLVLHLREAIIYPFTVSPCSTPKAFSPLNQSFSLYGLQTILMSVCLSVFKLFVVFAVLVIRFVKRKKIKLWFKINCVHVLTKDELN